MKNITEYVLGFAIDEFMEEVVLIQKKRPVWQNGLLNGVGGHVEKNETHKNAMVREFIEETGIQTVVDDWNPLCILKGKDFRVEVFYTKSVDIDNIQSMTDEIVKIRYIDSIIMNTYECISNLPWMLSLILDEDLLSGKIIPPTIEYN